MGSLLWLLLSVATAIFPPQITSQFFRMVPFTEPGNQTIIIWLYTNIQVTFLDIDPSTFSGYESDLEVSMAGALNMSVQQVNLTDIIGLSNDAGTTLDYRVENTAQVDEAFFDREGFQEAYNTQLAEIPGLNTAIGLVTTTAIPQSTVQFVIAYSNVPLEQLSGFATDLTAIMAGLLGVPAAQVALALSAFESAGSTIAYTVAGTADEVAPLLNQTEFRAAWLDAAAQVSGLNSVLGLATPEPTQSTDFLVGYSALGNGILRRCVPSADTGFASANPQECMDLVRRTPACSHQFFSHGSLGGHQCFCVAKGTDCTAEENLEVAQGFVTYRIDLTFEPTLAPTVSPTDIPTSDPTDVPTLEPTDLPTRDPTKVPTNGVMEQCGCISHRCLANSFWNGDYTYSGSGVWTREDGGATLSGEFIAVENGTYWQFTIPGFNLLLVSIDPVSTPYPPQILSYYVYVTNAIVTDPTDPSSKVWIQQVDCLGESIACRAGACPTGEPTPFPTRADQFVLVTRPPTGVPTPAARQDQAITFYNTDTAYLAPFAGEISRAFAAALGVDPSPVEGVTFAQSGGNVVATFTYVVSAATDGATTDMGAFLTALDGQLAQIPSFTYLILASQQDIRFYETTIQYMARNGGNLVLAYAQALGIDPSLLSMAIGLTESPSDILVSYTYPSSASPADMDAFMTSYQNGLTGMYVNLVGSNYTATSNIPFYYTTTSYLEGFDSDLQTAFANSLGVSPIQLNYARTSPDIISAFYTYPYTLTSYTSLQDPTTFKVSLANELDAINGLVYFLETTTATPTAEPTDSPTNSPTFSPTQTPTEAVRTQSVTFFATTEGYISSFQQQIVRAYALALGANLAEVSATMFQSGEDVVVAFRYTDSDAARSATADPAAFMAGFDARLSQIPNFVYFIDGTTQVVTFYGTSASYLQTFSGQIQEAFAQALGIEPALVSVAFTEDGENVHVQLTYPTANQPADLAAAMNDFQSRLVGFYVNLVGPGARGTYNITFYFTTESYLTDFEAELQSAFATAVQATPVEVQISQLGVTEHVEVSYSYPYTFEAYTALADGDAFLAAYRDALNAVDGLEYSLAPSFSYNLLFGGISPSFLLRQYAAEMQAGAARAVNISVGDVSLQFEDVGQDTVVTHLFSGFPGLYEEVFNNFINLIYDEYAVIPGLNELLGLAASSTLNFTYAPTDLAALAQYASTLESLMAGLLGISESSVSVSIGATGAGDTRLGFTVVAPQSAVDIINGATFLADWNYLLAQQEGLNTLLSLVESTSWSFGGLTANDFNTYQSNITGVLATILGVPASDISIQDVQVTGSGVNVTYRWIINEASQAAFADYGVFSTNFENGLSQIPGLNTLLGYTVSDTVIFIGVTPQELDSLKQQLIAAYALALGVPEGSVSINAITTRGGDSYVSYVTIFTGAATTSAPAAFALTFTAELGKIPGITLLTGQYHYSNVTLSGISPSVVAAYEAQLIAAFATALGVPSSSVSVNQYIGAGADTTIELYYVVYTASSTSAPGDFDTTWLIELAKIPGLNVLLGLVEAPTAFPTINECSNLRIYTGLCDDPDTVDFVFAIDFDSSASSFSEFVTMQAMAMVMQSQIKEGSYLGIVTTSDSMDLAPYDSQLSNFIISSGPGSTVVPMTGLVQQGLDMLNGAPDRRQTKALVVFMDSGSAPDVSELCALDSAGIEVIFVAIGIDASYESALSCMSDNVYVANSYPEAPALVDDAEIMCGTGTALDGDYVQSGRILEKLAFGNGPYSLRWSGEFWIAENADSGDQLVSRSTGVDVYPPEAGVWDSLLNGSSTGSAGIKTVYAKCWVVYDPTTAPSALPTQRPSSGPSRAPTGIQRHCRGKTHVRM